MQQRKFIRLIISEKIHKVGFRKFVKNKALELGVNAWVRNRINGTVDVVLSGDSSKVNELVPLCHQGPEKAEVNNIEFKKWKDSINDGFRIIKTKNISENYFINRTVSLKNYTQILKDEKRNGNFIECLDKLVVERNLFDKEFANAFYYAAKLCSKEEVLKKREAYERILSGLRTEELSENLINNSTKIKVPLENVSSFRGCVTLRSRKKQLLKSKLPEWRLNDKVHGCAFIDRLGVRRPRKMESYVSASQIPKKEGIVIKPSQGAGSRGVYLVVGFDKIIDAKKSRILSNWTELEKIMSENLVSGKIKKDQWIVEDLVFEDEAKSQPARDLKFYCFYGNVALVLEKSTFPEVKYCWWTPKGQYIRTGKYEDRLFQGDGVSSRDIELAASVSREIPAPFLRIDFFKTPSGMLFGEFTPRPGGYEQFNDDIDQWLGDYFLEAEARLVEDFLNGKRFDHFNNFLLGLKN